MNLLSAQTLANNLLQTHNLHDWKFRFDKGRVRFGCCNFTTQTISLSKILTQLNSPQIVRDTLLHEIAHAIVGKGESHGKLWKAKAREIGCNPTRCYTHDEVITPKAKYEAKCVSCGRSFPAFRKRKRVACGVCCKEKNGGRYSSEFRIIFQEI